MNVTVRQIAQLAGVSVSTASRALQGSELVSDVTRARVRDLAEKLNYRANPAAWALYHRRTQSIGLIWCQSRTSLTSTAYSIMLVGMSEAVDEHDHNLMLFVSRRRESGGPAGVLPKMLRERHVDGLIFIEELAVDLIDELRRRRIPSILVEGVVPAGLEDVHIVGIDFGAAARMAVRYLAGLGHRNIAYAFLAPGHLRPGDAFTGRDAILSYVSETARLGMPVWPHATDWEPDAERHADWILSAQPCPTAVLGYDDDDALRVMGAIERRGVRIPQDMSVMGSGGGLPGYLSYPPLTTLESPFREMGRRAAEILIARLGGQAFPPQRTLGEPRLLVRASTAAPGGSG